MKCRKTAFALVAAVAFFSPIVFARCDFSNMALPEDVYVKTSGTYSGAFGAKYYDLSEKFGATFISDLSEKMKGDVYKYVPDQNDQVMKYLLHKKLYDVPLDVGEYFDSMNLDSLLSQSMNFSKEIALPSLSKNAALPISAGATGPFPFEITIDANLDQCIKSATIGSGSITVKAAGSGATLNISSFTLTGIKRQRPDGRSNFDHTDFVDVSESGSFLINKKLDLAGATIVFPFSQVKATGQLSLASGSGSVSSPSQLVCDVSVQTFSEATADLSSVGGFKMDETTENKKTVSKEMVAYVKTINFGQQSGDVYYKSDASGTATSTKGQGKGIKFKAVNSFPLGNDIKISVISETFGINTDTNAYYNNGVLVAAANPANVPAKANETAFDQAFSEYGDIDVTNTSLFGTKTNPAYMKFKVALSNNQDFHDLRLGETYKISVSDTQMLFDWDKVEMDLSSSDPVNDTVDMKDFSFSSITDGLDGEITRLINNCDFESIPVYFMVKKPVGALATEIGNVTVSGKVFFKYTDSSSTQKTDYVVGNSSASANMPFCSSVAWPESGAVFTKAFVTEGVDYSFTDDVADTLNERPNDLTVNYSMGIGGGSSTINLYKARFDSLGENDNASIGVEMAAVLPLKVRVKSDTDLDIYRLAEMDMDGETDLMYRTEVSKTEDFAKYVGAISTLQLNYNFINNGVEGFDALVKVDDTHQGEEGASSYSGIVRTLALTGDSTDSIVFSNDEIKAALTHFFLPKMTLTVKQGILSLSRNAVETSSSIGVNPTVFLQLNDSVAVNVSDIIK
ncbi:MAG: hypothetical protein K6A42_10260 [Treponema sp.]|nr:hypothetical protein [Treponema sp.]